jgi:hypothetical protein
MASECPRVLTIMLTDAYCLSREGLSFFASVFGGTGYSPLTLYRTPNRRSRPQE